VTDDTTTEERRNFYGRIRGKTLRPSQKDYLANDLGQYELSGVHRDVNPARTPLALTGEVWLEIGYGGGEHLYHQAALNPLAQVIGCEIFVNTVAMLLGKLHEAPLANVSLYTGDVRDLLEVVPTASLSKAFLLYPDPWPKNRHHRRRFVTEGYLAKLAAAMKPGAEFRVATDIPDYVRQTLQEVPANGFSLTNQSGTAWPDWVSTRYEQKALRESRVPHYMTFKRD
jgi:tRNA (guanine-N7-)-methyltransferase